MDLYEGTALMVSRSDRYVNIQHIVQHGVEAPNHFTLKESQVGYFAVCGRTCH